MNLRKQIVIVLLTLVLFITVEPLAFCISYLYQSSPIVTNEAECIPQESFPEDRPEVKLSKNSKNAKGITNIAIKLNGNRLAIAKKKLFNEACENLLQKHQERQKPSIPSMDFNISYLCPENNLYNYNYNISNFLSDWSYNDKSYNCFLAILTPPPQQVGEPIEV